MGNLRNQYFWNFAFVVFFFFLLLASIVIIRNQYGGFPTSIPMFDVVLIIFAVFRLTRLFVYDKIVEFVRDWFLKVEEEYRDGSIVAVRRKFDRGVRRAVSDLFDCPWCISVWMALALVFLYFFSPVFWYVILLLAISGAASFLQILSNLVGWDAEDTKLHVKEHGNH